MTEVISIFKLIIDEPFRSYALTLLCIILTNKAVKEVFGDRIHQCFFTCVSHTIYYFRQLCLNVYQDIKTTLEALEEPSRRCKKISGWLMILVLSSQSALVGLYGIIIVMLAVLSDPPFLKMMLGLLFGSSLIGFAHLLRADAVKTAKQAEINIYPWR